MLVFKAWNAPNFQAVCHCTLPCIETVTRARCQVTSVILTDRDRPLIHRSRVIPSLTNLIRIALQFRYITDFVVVVYEDRGVPCDHIVRVGFSRPARSVTYVVMAFTWAFSRGEHWAHRPPSTLTATVTATWRNKRRRRVDAHSPPSALWGDALAPWVYRTLYLAGGD